MRKRLIAMVMVLLLALLSVDNICIAMAEDSACYENFVSHNLMDTSSIHLYDNISENATLSDAFSEAACIEAAHIDDAHMGQQNSKEGSEVEADGSSVASVMDADYDFEQSDEQLYSSEDYSNTGYIDIGERVDYYVPSYTLYGLQGGSELPVKYDSRELGRVTSVKNQGSDGTCWSFAAMSSCESNMISKGLAVEPDYSEFQFAYFFYHNVVDKLANLKNDSTSIIDGSSYLKLGGNNYFSLFSMASWRGLVDEDRAPYIGVNDETVLDDSLAYDSDSVHIRNSYIINMRNVDDVKKMIMEYGAVSCEMYLASHYYNSETDGYYQNVSTSSNHAVSIVGWDDEYSVENYKGVSDNTFVDTNKFYPGQTVAGTPSANGAWLIKNSYGDSNKPYIWVSYEDVCVSNANAFVFDCEPVGAYDLNYQYDGTAVAASSSLKNGYSICNVYTIDGASIEEVKAASIALKDDNVRYSLQFYLNPTEDNPLSGVPVLSEPQEGITTYAGYYTIELDEPFKVSMGDRVAVVFTLYNMDDTSDEGKVSYFIDMDGVVSSAIKFDSYTEPGQMYLIDRTGVATDYYKPSNDRCPRIKMFTSIEYVDISMADVEAVGPQCYTGSLIEPQLKLSYKGTLLEEGTDYEVEYSNNIIPGRASVTISGLGGYKGKRTLYFDIIADISKAEVSSVGERIYSGQNICPEPKVSFAGFELTNGTDYVLTYDNNLGVGAAVITIFGKGKFFGSRTISFNIIGNLDDCELDKIADVIYSGKAVTPVPVVKFNDVRLVKDVDYSVSYSNNDRLGTACVSVKGMGRYTGAKTICFKIVGAAASFTYSLISAVTYTGKAKKPAVVIRYNGNRLVEGVDYTLTYSNNINVGTAKIAVKGKGKYTGTKTIKFNIVGKASSFSVSNISDRAYTGKYIKPTPTVRFNGKKLKLGTDYTLAYSNNKKPGKATVIIKGKGKYTGTKKVSFKIVGKASAFSVSKVSDRNYTGKLIKPVPTVKFKGSKLKKGIDYTLTYSNNRKVGTATIVIRGKGYYTGVKKIRFKIVSKK